MYCMSAYDLQCLHDLGYLVELTSCPCGASTALFMAQQGMVSVGAMP